MRPLPPPVRSERRSTVRGPVTSQSGAVWPSPRPSINSLLATETMWQLRLASQMSATETETPTGTIWWLGGHSTLGVAVALPITGGVVSTTSTVAVHCAGFPESSWVEKLTGVVIPTPKKAGALLERIRVESQTSVALAPARKPAMVGLVSGVPPVCVHSTVTLDGQVTTGAVVSWTRTVMVSASGGQAARSVASSRQVTVGPSVKNPLGVAVFAPVSATAGQLQLNVMAFPSGSVLPPPFRVTFEPPVALHSETMSAPALTVSGKFTVSPYAWANMLRSAIDCVSRAPVV